jgi:Fe-S cluster assembly protein SufB
MKRLDWKFCNKSWSMFECAGANSKISWTQVETRSSITWKYPSCILMGDNSQGDFYSVALTYNYQQADNL